MSKKNKKRKSNLTKQKNNKKIEKSIKEIENNKELIGEIKKEIKPEKKEKNNLKKTKLKKEKNTNKNSKIKKNLDYNAISIEELESELKKETYKSKYFNILSSTIYGLIIVAAFAAIIATLIMPVFQISGSSMKPVLNNGDLVISIKTKKLNSGDIIAFYHGNKILVKRVIARAGQWVVIDESGKVYVDGVLLEEPYIESFVLGDCDIKFPYQVPAESWFVLGDNRTIFTDSRNSEIGSIKEEDIIGKILFKLWDTNK
jgi:signal peptidase I